MPESGIVFAFVSFNSGTRQTVLDTNSGTAESLVNHKFKTELKGGKKELHLSQT